MKENSDKEAQDSPRGKRVLGKLPEGERDSELEPAPEGTFGVQSASPPDIDAGGPQQRKGSKPPTRASHRRAPRTEVSDGDKPALPEDGLVAMRKSGGLRFTSKSVVIYRDGRVTIDGTGYGAARRTPAKRLDDEEFAELYRALDTANFPELTSTIGRQNPDGYAYEIAARIGADTYAVEAFDGSIPEELAPLIAFLSRQMRPSRQAR